jgi:hypothetical protein
VLLIQQERGYGVIILSSGYIENRTVLPRSARGCTIAPEPAGKRYSRSFRRSASGRSSKNRAPVSAQSHLHGIDATVRRSQNRSGP